METELSTEVKIGPCSLGMEVVLNGGKEILESATVPIQWFFTPETADQKPTHLLIIDHDENQLDGNNWKTGRRYVAKVTAAIDFLAVYKPGRHRITVLAFAGEKKEVEEALGELLKKSNSRCYSEDVYIDDIYKYITTKNKGWKLSRLVGATIKEIEVPDELFSHQPKSRFGTFLWNWVNRWHDSQPMDQCHFRRRCIMAFTVQPPLFFIGHVLKYIAAFFASILVLGLRLGCLFFGFRPVPLFEEFDEIWAWSPHDAKNYWQAGVAVQRYPQYGSNYRLWSAEGYSISERRYMPVAPWEAVVGGVVAIVILELICKTILSIGSLNWRSALIAVILTPIFIWLGRIAPWGKWLDQLKYKILKRRELAKQKKAEQKKTDPVKKLASPDQKYLNWLHDNLDVAKAPTKITLSKVPLAYKGGVVQRFKIGFWAAKMKVCRPYAQK